MEGYYGYGPLFVIHVVLSLAVYGLSLVSGAARGFVLLGGVIALMIGIGLLSYRINRKVGEGAGWSQTQVVLASIAIPLGTICYGVVGYVVLRQIALNHIKRFGVRSGLFDLNKKAVKARIQELRDAEAAPR